MLRPDDPVSNIALRPPLDRPSESPSDAIVSGHCFNPTGSDHWLVWRDEDLDGFSLASAGADVGFVAFRWT